MKRAIHTTLLVLMLVFICLSEAYGIQKASMKLEPNVVIIGASYNGTILHVKGTIPEDAQAAIEVIGHRKDTEFKKKGKALGILWMNIGDVTFHNVPNLYLVYMGNISYNKGVPIGFEAIKKEIAITPESEDKEFLFSEFIKLKKKEGLYAIHKNAITYGTASNGLKPFSCAVALPARLVPGSYQVKLIVWNDNGVISSKSKTLKVKEEGLPNLVASLAFKHGALYGILATVIAILAGLLMGLLFKGGKGGH